jgi:hypothetical protein
MLPSADPEPGRYEGRPLLIVLENYVLDCIGALEVSSQNAMCSAVQRVFKGDDDWHETLRRQLHLPHDLDDQLRQIWQRNSAVAVERGETLLPVQFAKMVADEHFVPLIDRRPRNVKPWWKFW